MSYILVIDDIESEQRLLKSFLETDGYLVRTVSTMKEGIITAYGVLPDLVLVDLLLPDAFGFSAVREFSKLAPTVVISALYDSGSKVTALDAGAVDYIVKPWNGEELLARIRGILRRKKDTS